MDEIRRTLRLDIDGYWTAEDMAASFSHLNDLYRMRLVLQVVAEESRELDHLMFEFFELRRMRPWRKRHLLPFMLFPGWAPTIQLPPLSTVELGRVAELLYPDRPLAVRKVEYGSPGFKDLAGIGEIVGHIKDFVLRIIEHRAMRRRRQLEDERMEVDIQRMRIENAREFMRVAAENQYTPGEVRQLIHWIDDRQETLIRLVDEGKVQPARLLEETPNDEEGRKD